MKHGIKYENEYEYENNKLSDILNPIYHKCRLKGKMLI